MKFWLSLLAAFAIVAGVTVAVPVAVEIDSAASLLQEPRVEPEHASLKPTCSGSTPTITGTSGDDVLVGTPGDDVIVGRGGDDTIDGRGGNDIIIGGAGDDTIRGGNGDDLICGNKGVDTLSGNGGADRISGSSGADIISGGGGDDVLFGGSDADQISGNAGADTISGGADDDQLNGQGDNDVMFGDGGADVIQGRGGNDELWGSGGADEIRGGEGDDFIAGGAGQDRLFGSAGADEIQGDNGNDRLWGGPGDDVLNGLEGGNDRIVGGDGTDTCTGETPAECEIGDGAPELEMACSFVANADTADFSWNGAIDATRYDLQRSDDGATWVEVTRKSDPQATQLSHQVTDFTADSQYRLTIINNRQLIGVETCEDSTEPVGDAGVSAPVCAADAPLIGEPTAIVAWSLDIGDTFEVDRSLDNGATWELEALFLRANLGGGENVNRDPDIKNLYRVRYIENGEEVRLLECGNSFPDEPPVGPQPLPVPRLYVTSDGTSEVEVAWSALSSDVAQVEVFRDGTSIGTTSTGSITEAPDFGPLVFTYTAQSVGADGNRSDMSEMVTFIPSPEGECVAVGLNDGTTAVTWVDAPEGDITLLDYSNGLYRPLEWLPRNDAGVAYYVDSFTDQAGQPSPDYRVTLVRPDGTLSSQDCDGRSFSTSEFARLDAMDFPVTDDGMIGRSTPAGASAIRINPSPLSEGSLPTDAAGEPEVQDLCSAAGLGLTFTPGDFADGNQPSVTVEVEVPAGLTVMGDLYRSAGPFDGGVGIARVNADGTTSNAGSFRTSQLIGARTVEQRAFTASATGTYRMTLVKYWSGAANGAVHFGNVRFVDNNGDFVADPCAGLEQITECIASGGGVYVAPGTSVQRDGQLLGPGCYAVETCASDSSFGAIFDSVSRWACRNEPFLDTAQDVGVATAVVLGTIVFAPVSAGVVVTGAGAGLVLSAWTCDQSDNPWYEPSLELDSSCVATEVSLGAVFAPLAGAGPTATVGRAVAVGCVEGGTSTAVYGYQHPDTDIDPANVAIGTTLGCGTGGIVHTGLNSIRTRPRGVTSPVEGSRRTFSSSSTPAPNGATISLDEAAMVASNNGIDMRMIKLEFEAGQPLNLFGFTSVNGSGQLFRSPDGRFIVTLTDAGLSSPQAALNTIAHELNHIREVLNGPTGHFIDDEAAATAAGNIAEAFFK